MAKIFGILGVIAVIVVAFVYYIYFDIIGTPEVEEASNLSETNDVKAWTTATEKYSARVDRVNVAFEHKDFTKYRLTTNSLVREGELNTERGFENDPDATVFVLNWQRPEGERIYYVKLTSEPSKLYVLDSNREIIKGSALTLDNDSALASIKSFTWLHEVVELNADYPKSEVRLLINRSDGTQELKQIATVDGSCAEMPVETTLALNSEQLLCYYAGFGYQYRVIAIGDSFVVQQREIEEASPDYNPPIAEFVTIMEIE